MRQIEKEMLDAVESGREWSKDNTAVTMPLLGRLFVFLHGHHIATVDRLKVTPNVQTLREWPTRTTMSRLRALGVDVCTRKGVVHLNGEPL